MIREYTQADVDQILEIWLSASIEAHHFIEPEFWHSTINDMRDVYIPASETFVLESERTVIGFHSLNGENLAAIFVAPELQGKGIGTALLDNAKSRRKNLRPTVYRENISSVRFYEKHGFNSAGEQMDEHTGHPELIMAYHS
ncbi:N-acetyltransferase [Marinobacter halodurans]|uniref:N-acetyltransferase n=1 Tax=Marinobacter halodurans TaxID=2528979 RepID=A0ABY1ZMU2_9GAMM|nr:N-acetyltransferase [Marinobacter halodurans]TBW57720.1 N-acetyltransferase [Marinobacter halodurans]